MRTFQRRNTRGGKSSTSSVFKCSDDSVMRLARLIVSESKNEDDYPRAYELVQESSRKAPA